jgi:ribose-phosphate pyrophosphokinase
VQDREGNSNRNMEGNSMEMKDMVLERDVDPNSLSQSPIQSQEVVIAGPESVDLATNISKALGLNMVCPELRIFSDGESKIRIKEKLDNKTCIIIQSSFPPHVDRHIMQTLMLMKKCADDSAKNIIVVVPYLAYARQDSAFLEGEVVTAEMLAKMYENFGAQSMVTVDIHSLRALSYFQKRMHSINVSAIPLLADYAKQLGMNLNNSITVSPDEGGLMRAKSFALQLNNNVTCLKKTRDRSTGEIKVDHSPSLKEGRIRGLEIVLIDDIVSTGSTIIKAAEILKSGGCRGITVMCSHALMTEESIKQIKASGVDKIVTTNSVPKKEAIGTFVEAIDLSSVISSTITKMIA